MKSAIFLIALLNCIVITAQEAQNLSLRSAINIDRTRSSMIQGIRSAYHQAEFESMFSSDNWNGGYVEGMGYVGMECIVEEKSRMTSQFGGNSFVGYPAEGIGLTAGTNVRGYTVIENGNIIVSVNNAAYIRPEMNQNKPTGVAILYVNGQEMEVQSLVLQGANLYRTGDSPIGQASFSLARYTGKVEIRVHIYFEYYNGTGYNNHTYEEIVYSRDR